ncbi:DUF4127 family protein [Fimbriimonas ginsengisoli]|uniref:DUF4127 family protein n=1 Tax=Fimbriimonas ginsengisoli Gsoil 348 TaxID=661478 RepID=A0A068NQK1_FIMGI|nr:DUF4127 family protein [Fimbriimonas ginsengisoli]AIE85015.1 hypothetical protein OP10G_1647 [Fimbriimonas ginsengisoli Gsoil 348]
MRLFAVIAMVLGVAAARAERILLVPLDSRPAAGQFAQMISHIAGQDLRMPPYETLGRFTNPGDPDAILRWIATQDLSDVDTIIVSADMICYGGLVASRVNNTPAEVAVQRLRTLADIRRRSPKTKLYVFSSTMRLAPTATRAAGPWRMKLAQFEELQDRVQRLRIDRLKPELEALRPQIPPGEIARYEATRVRNHSVQREMVRMAAARQIDYLVIGQDDAKPYGPHVPESEALRAEVRRSGADSRVYFCEGIDQHASVLVSRALLQQAGWRPRVRVVYSDPAGKYKFASYESKPIEQSLRDQLVASGARLADPNGEYDYSLYVNTPKRREAPFKNWLAELTAELDQGMPVAVADINLANDGTADSDLFDTLADQTRVMKLLAFAGWNTAGNTMGTAIPAANVYLLAKKLNVSPLMREVSQREFLLHRFVDDYAFHKYTRPVAYSMILSPNHDEVYGIDFSDLTDFVQRDVEKHVDRLFQNGFMNQRFYVGNEPYVFTGVRDVKVWLPWPRAYEMRLELHLEAKPEVAAGPGG